MLEVTIVPVLQDNYSYIIQSGSTVAVVDPGEAQPVIDKLDEMGLTPNYVINTHHHSDHIDGNEKLENRYCTRLIAPASEQDRIKGINISVEENQEMVFGEEVFKVFETPGHTKGHVCFYFPESKVLFSGDTLFSMGCGRLFEGTADDMFTSMSKLKALPEETTIYCGHEYTESNGEFCLSVEPGNDDLKNRMEEVKALRAEKKPTIPTTMAQENKTNVFLRAKDPSEFAHYRTMKDNF